MDSTTQKIDLKHALAHEPWVRKLVAGLVADSDVDDVVQQTWLAVIEGSPRPSTLRGFIASVVRRRAARLHRDASRRRRRDEVAARDEAVPSTELMLERMQVQREIAEIVEGLDEPFRTTILLRYFEGLRATEIAERLGLPIATVRSRLHRGIVRIRQQLEVRRGADWRGALGVLFFGRAGEHVACAAPVSLVAGVYAMSGFYKMASVAVASCVLLLLCWVVVPFESGSVVAGVEDDTSKHVGVELPVDGQEPADSSLGGAVGERTRLVEAEATEIRRRVRGRVYNPEGVPIPDVVVQPHEFQPGQMGEGEALELTEKTTTDALGSFSLLTSESSCALFVGPGYSVLRAAVVPAGQEDVTDLVVVAAPAGKVEGVVVDQDGNAIADAQLMIYSLEIEGFPFSLEGTLSPRDTTVCTDAQGRFVIPSIPICDQVKMLFHKSGFRSRRVSPMSMVNGYMRVELQRLAADGSVIYGQVIDSTGRVVSGAKVLFGYQNATVSNERGEFEIGFPRRPSSMSVVKRGFQAAVLPSARPELNPQWARKGETLVVTIGEAVLEIAGRVVHADGRPAVGLMVKLVDPTMAGRMQALESLASEAEAEGEAKHWGFMAQTAVDGSFAVGGLANRDYRLRVVDRATLLCVESEPLAAGNKAVEIVVPADAIVAEVTGRVVGPKGQAIAGAKVSLHLRTGPMTGMAAPPGRGRTVTDEDGCFSLSDVPHQSVRLIVVGADITETVVKLKDRDLSAPLEIEVGRVCRIRIEPSAGMRGGTVHFEDSEGKSVALLTRTASYTMSRRGWEVGEKPSAVFVIDSLAEHVVWTRDGKELGRRRIALDPFGLDVQVVVPGN